MPCQGGVRCGRPTFEVLQEVGNCLAFVLKQERLVRVLPSLSTWSEAPSAISPHAAHERGRSQQLLQTPPMMLMRCHRRRRMSPMCAYESRRFLGTKGGYDAGDEVVLEGLRGVCAVLEVQDGRCGGERGMGGGLER